MTDNNHTVKQVLNIIEYGTKEPVFDPAFRNERADGTPYFRFEQAEAQRVKVLNAMGVHGTKSKVPVEASGECSYDGVLVMDDYVPLKYTLRRSSALLGSGTRKVSTHRLFVRCPWCLEDQPIGRIHQHIGSKPCKAKMAKVYAQKTVSLDTVAAVGYKASVEAWKAVEK